MEEFRCLFAAVLILISVQKQIGSLLLVFKPRCLQPSVCKHTCSSLLVWSEVEKDPGMHMRIRLKVVMTSSIGSVEIHASYTLVCCEQLFMSIRFASAIYLSEV
jgi:hypothetical protein